MKKIRYETTYFIQYDINLEIQIRSFINCRIDTINVAQRLRVLVLFFFEEKEKF
jgi:hypothetical protein